MLSRAAPEVHIGRNLKDVAASINKNSFIPLPHFDRPNILRLRQYPWSEGNLVSVLRREIVGD